jgi:hypothetical protein
VQRWSPKLKESDHEIVAKMVDKVQVWLGGFRLSNVAGSDIMELWFVCCFGREGPNLLESCGYVVVVFSNQLNCNRG